MSSRKMPCRHHPKSHHPASIRQTSCTQIPPVAGVRSDSVWNPRLYCPFTPKSPVFTAKLPTNSGSHLKFMVCGVSNQDNTRSYLTAIYGKYFTTKIFLYLLNLLSGFHSCREIRFEEKTICKKMQPLYINRQISVL